MNGGLQEEGGMNGGGGGGGERREVKEGQDGGEEMTSWERG